MYLKAWAAFGSFHSVRSFGVCMLYDLVFIRVRVGCIPFPPEFMATTVFILTSPFWRLSLTLAMFTFSLLPSLSLS